MDRRRAGPRSGDARPRVRLDLFWTGEGATELAVLHRLLAPGGRLVIAHGPTPHDRQEAVLSTVSENVTANGFLDASVILEEAGSAVVASR